MLKRTDRSGVVRWCVSNFEAAYYRIGTIQVCQKAVCDVCKDCTVVLGIDSSEGEYGMGCICLPCIQKAFDSSNREEPDAPPRTLPPEIETNTDSKRLSGEQLLDIISTITDSLNIQNSNSRAYFCADGALFVRG